MIRNRCVLCHQLVILARTEAHGRPFALDPAPDPAGNQAVFQPPAGPLQTRQLSKGEKPRPYETVFMPHVATCPKRLPPKAEPKPLPPNVIPITRAKQKRRGTKRRPKGTR